MLEILDRSACVELLQSVAIGRVAWATESGDAVVVPVNFVAVDDGLSSGPLREPSSPSHRKAAGSRSRLTTWNRPCRSGGVS